MRTKNEMDSRLYLRLVRACFILAAVVLAFGVGKWMQRDVYAGNSKPGGTYKVSELAGTENWQFTGDVTIEMDKDASFMSLDADGYDLTIKGNKTLTINGNTILIDAYKLTVEDTTMKLTVNEGASGLIDAISVQSDVALKNVNLEIDNPKSEGIYSTKGDIIIEGGSVKIDSESYCIDTEDDDININKAEVDLKSINTRPLWAQKNIYIRNSNVNIDTEDGIYADAGDISIDNSELKINCRYNNGSALVAYLGKVVFSDNIYIKSPVNGKVGQGEYDNNILCNADGTPASSCIIAKKRVSDDICKISAIPVQNYTGAAITPAVTATWNGTAMKEGTDFTVTYKNNTNVGTATATVTGKGIYTGTKDITFTIADSMSAGTKVKAGGQEYKVINATTAAFTKAKNKKSITVPATITANGRTFAVTQVNAKAFKGKKIRTVTIGKNVTKIKANAFKGSPATKLILKTKLLKKKTVKNALKGSKIKTAQVKVGKSSANKKIKKAYKKFFTKKVLGRKVTLK